MKTIKRILAAAVAAVTMTTGLSFQFSDTDIFVGLTEMSVSADSTEQTSGDYKYKEDTDGVIITSYTGSDKTLTIPDKLGGSAVIGIGQRAFRKNADIVSVTLPETVKTINECAFEGCSALKSVTLNEGLEALSANAFQNSSLAEVNIPSTLSKSEYPFYHCEKLKKVTFAKSLTAIPKYLFAHCTGLEKIELPEGITSIGYQAFYESSLTSITLPKSLETVNDGVFQGCDALESVTFKGSIPKISSSMFGSCDALESIDIPEGVETIESHAFRNCKALKSVTIPQSVRKTAAYAFESCTSLASVTLNEGLEELDDSAFSNTPISEIYIPSTLKSADYPFKGCKKLNKVTFAKSLTAIPKYLFAYCKGLESIDIPEGITGIGYQAFYDCTALTSVTLPKSLETVNDGVFQGCDALKSVTFKGSIPKISSAMFLGCDALESIDIPEGVETIESHAFRNCKALKSVTIPQSVRKTAAYAFESCTSLASVTLNEGLEELGEYAFSDTPISEIYIPSTLKSASGPFKDCQKLNKVTFAKSLTAIPKYLFAHCTGLEKIEIPEGITSIGYQAFYGCSALTSVTLPKSLETVNDGVFQGCDALKSVTFKGSIKTISSAMFNGCDALESIDIPEGVETIESHAFRNCKALKAITMPKTVRKIGMYAFDDCTALSSVTLNEGLEEIGEYAFCGTAISEIYIPSTVKSASEPFYQCNELRYASVGSGMKKLPVKIFQYCKALRQVTLPESVDTIGDYAFDECADLSRIISDREEFSFERHSFDNCISLNDSRFTLIDRNNTCFITNAETGAVNGLVNYTVKYKLKDSAAASAKDIQLILDIPSGMTLLPESIKCSDEKLGIKKNAGDTYTLSQPQGTFTFSARINEYGDYTVSASLKFTHNSTNWKVTVGKAKVDVPQLTVNASNTVNERKTDVYGIAGKGETVKIYVNGKLAETVTANKYTGKYKATVPLPEGSSEEVYSIHAETDGNVSDDVKTTYSADKPVVNNIVMRYNGDRETDITHVLKEGASPVVSFNPKKELGFEVDISNSDGIGKVYITSTRGAETKYIEANYDPDTGKWIAEGMFDPENPNYVPASMNVSTVPKRDITVGDPDTVSDEYNTNTLPQKVKDNSSYKVVEQSDGYFAAEATVSNGKESDTLAYVSTRSDTITYDGKTVTAEQVAKDPEAYGFQYSSVKVTSDGKTTEYYVSVPKQKDLQKTAMENIRKMTNFADSVWSGVFFLEKTEEKLFGGDTQKLSFVNNLVASSANELAGDFITKYIFPEYNIAGKLISAGKYISDYKCRFDAIGDNENLRNAATYAAIFRTLHEIGLTKAACVCVGMPPFCVFLVDFAVGECISSLEQYIDLCIENGMEFTMGGFIRFIIDPSGIVYEAVISNPVEDAEMTVYYLDPDTKKQVLWNAGDYDQYNPISSDSEGYYAWDVPEGKWKVVCKKEGYDTLESEWLDVPPVQTEVHFSLVSHEAPKLLSAEKRGGELTVRFSKFMDITTVNSDTLTLKGVGADCTITPMLYEESDPYSDTFIITGDIDSVSAVSIADKCVSYSGAGSKKSTVNVKSVNAPTTTAVTSASETTTTTITIITTTTAKTAKTTKKTTAVSTTAATTSAATTTTTTTKAATTTTTTTTTFIVTTITTVTTTAEPQTGTVKGDANLDGKLNVRDAAYIARMLAAKKQYVLSSSADFNGDGKINVRDAAAIAAYLAKGGGDNVFYPYMLLDMKGYEITGKYGPSEIIEYPAEGGNLWCVHPSKLPNCYAVMKQVTNNPYAEDYSPSFRNDQKPLFISLFKGSANGEIFVSKTYMSMTLDYGDLPLYYSEINNEYIMYYYEDKYVYELHMAEAMKGMIYPPEGEQSGSFSKAFKEKLMSHMLCISNICIYKR